MDRKRFAEKPELLAPAGDLARAKTAVRYGADAVYLGGPQFSLRSRASNFTLADIAEACRYAHERGSRIHVTVNMIPHEEDYDGLKEYLEQLQEIGVDALIIASPAVMELARTYAPKAEIHCSTQMSVTNAEAARFLYDTLKIDRVVLGRECTLEDVRSITAASPAEVEAFIHGGMCVSYSGRCTLSNRMTLRDANRGGCAQSCRWFYHLYDGETELSTQDSLLTMGSKDLCAVQEIASLWEAGVRSFKIEGRMKTEYYVASIVSGYRHLLDDLYAHEGELSSKRLEAHRREIMKGENRAVWNGFYGGVRGAEGLISDLKAGNDVNHDFLGTVASYDPAGGTMTMITRNPFDLGETMEVLSPGQENRTFRISEIKNENGEYLEISRQPMKELRLKVPFAVRPDDILRRSREDDH